MTESVINIILCDLHHKILIFSFLCLGKPNQLMKNTALLLGALFFAVSCTKSETQYTDQGNKRQSVNDTKSDTIQTINEVSDTLQMGNDSTDVKTDNE